MCLGVFLFVCIFLFFHFCRTISQMLLNILVEVQMIVEIPSWVNLVTRHVLVATESCGGFSLTWSCNEKFYLSTIDLRLA